MNVTTAPVPAMARLRTARNALRDAHTSFLREAAGTTDTDRLNWLHQTATDLRNLADQIDEVMR
jgi:hypothetical protein